LNNFENLK